VYLGAVRFLPETDTAGKHYHLVKTVALHVSEMLEGQHRAADKGLPELVPEVAGPVGCLDQYLFRCLVEPFARLTVLFPLPWSVRPGVGGHVDGCAGNGQGALAARDTVTYLAAGAGGGSVEWLNGGGEVMGFSLQGKDRLDIF
jgi:hypothetical protein